MSDFSLVLQMAALGTGFCFLMTTLGAASVLFTGKESSPAFQRISLGFAAGIMVAASVWSLLIPSLEASSKDAIPWLPATGGFVLGIAFLLLMDKTIPHWHPAEDSPEGPKSNHSRTELLVAAVTLHNIPEGMSVGLAFAMAAITGEASTLSAAGALALGIGSAWHRDSEYSGRRRGCAPAERRRSVARQGFYRRVAFRDRGADLRDSRGFRGLLYPALHALASRVRGRRHDVCGG